MVMRMLKLFNIIIVNTCARQKKSIGIIIVIGLFNII